MKTCPKCGYTTENDQAKFCKKCGTSLLEAIFSPTESSTQPDTESTPTPIDATLINTDITYQKVESVKPTIPVSSPGEVTEANDTSITAESLKENSEIGGWLAFFLFSICLGGMISAIMSLVQVNSVDYQGSILLALTDVALGVMLCTLGFYTFYSFLQRKPDAVYLGKLYVVTTFLSNLLALFNGDYDATGLRSEPQIIRGLIWGVIWYAFLCVSKRVKEVIPKEYRKKTAKDYYITAALYLIPIVLFVAGVATLSTVHQKQQEQFVQTAQLADRKSVV